MKISTNLLFQKSIDQMGSSQNELSNLQAKLSSGKKIVNASDNPEEVTNIQRLKNVIERQNSIEKNLLATKNRLNLEEAGLKSSSSILTRLRELAIQASNDTLTGENRKLVSIEIDELRGELLSVANMKDSNGNYVFSGSRVRKKPFDADPSGKIIYQGDQTRNLVDVGENRQIHINRPGTDIYTQVSRKNLDGSNTAVGFFEAIDNLSSSIKSSRREGIDQGVEDLEKMGQSMSLALAKVGSGIVVVESQTDLLDETRLQLKSALSTIEDVDYAEAVTEMKKKMLSLEAAQSSFARISQLSLFNYIN